MDSETTYSFIRNSKAIRDRMIAIINAKKLLENEGYHVGNLWRTEDVCNRYDCTNEDAEKILDDVIESQYISEIIFEMIDDKTQEMNFKRLQ